MIPPLQKVWLSVEVGYVRVVMRACVVLATKEEVAAQRQMKERWEHQQKSQRTGTCGSPEELRTCWWDPFH